MEGREEKRSGSVDRVCLLSERWSRVSDFLLEKLALTMEIHVFLCVFQVYMRRRRQEEMDVWKNKDLLPAFSNSGVHFFLIWMQMSGFFPLQWTNLFRGGEDSKAHPERCQHRQCGANRSKKKNSRRFSQGKEGNIH